MAEILIRSQSPISHKIFWNGDVAIPDALPAVKVYDVTSDPAIVPAIPPTQLLTVLQSTADENNPGTYFVNIPYQYTDRNKTLRLQWEYAINGSIVIRSDEVFIVTPYVDFNHTQDLGFSTDPSDPEYKSYKELLAAEKYARKQIEQYTGQNFFLYDDVIVKNGYGSDILPLPAKIYELHELYANDILLLDNINNIKNWPFEVVVTETGYGIRINRANVLDNITYTANGMIPPSVSYDNGLFKSDVSYKVQGRFGWEKVPDEIELAAIELMKDYFSKDKLWRNKYVTNVSTFDWQFEYSSEAYAGTGNAYVDRLLQNYVMVSKVEVI